MNICFVLASRAFDRALTDVFSSLSNHSLTFLYPQGNDAEQCAFEITSKKPDVLLMDQDLFSAGFNGNDVAKHIPQGLHLIGIDHKVRQDYCHQYYPDKLTLAQAHNKGEPCADEYLRLAQNLLDMLPEVQQL